MRFILITLIFGLTLLMSVGCSDIEDPAEDLNKTTLIYLSNGNQNLVYFSVEGESNTTDILLLPRENKLIYTQHRDNYIVSNSENEVTASFEKDSAGFYGVCGRISGGTSSGGVVQDVASQNNRREITLINLQTSNLIIATNSLNVLDSNGLVIARNTEDLSVTGCQKAVITMSGNIVLSRVNTIEINGVASHVPDYDPFIEANITKLQMVDLDIVYYRSGTYTLLPLAPFSTLEQ